MATIYRKTAKGFNEIQTRALKLAPRFRSLLILVDGRRSDEDLRSLMPQEDALRTLVDSGFIEAIGETAAPAGSGDSQAPSAPSSAADKSAATGPAKTQQTSAIELNQRKREAVRALSELVGPSADTLAIRIERARSPDELSGLLQAASQVIASARGRAAAADFVQRFGLH